MNRRDAERAEIFKAENTVGALLAAPWVGLALILFFSVSSVPLRFNHVFAFLSRSD